MCTEIDERNNHKQSANHLNQISATAAEIYLLCTKRTLAYAYAVITISTAGVPCKFEV